MAAFLLVNNNERSMKSNKLIARERMIYKSLLQAERVIRFGETQEYNGDSLMFPPLYHESFSWFGFKPQEYTIPDFYYIFGMMQDVINNNKYDDDKKRKICIKIICREMSLREVNYKQHWEKFSGFVNDLMEAGPDKLSESQMLKNWSDDSFKDLRFEHFRLIKLWEFLWNYMVTIDQPNTSRYIIHNDNDFNLMMNQFSIDYPDIKE